MTERPPSRLYLPWLSWLVLGLTAIAFLAMIILAAVLIASHQFRGLMKLLVVILVVLIASSVLLVKFRKRFDEFIQTDGQTFLRFWSPTREITIDRGDVVSITSTARQVVVENSKGSIIIDRRYPEFESLKTVVEEWRSGAGGGFPRLVVSDTVKDRRS